jgi:hypothetical protein
LYLNIRLAGKSSKLAKDYGVSAKTIRDIWNGKSWTKVTGHLHAIATREGQFRHFEDCALHREWLGADQVEQRSVDQSWGVCTPDMSWELFMDARVPEDPFHFDWPHW